MALLVQRFLLEKLGPGMFNDPKDDVGFSLVARSQVFPGHDFFLNCDISSFTFS